MIREEQQTIPLSKHSKILGSRKTHVTLVYGTYIQFANKQQEVNNAEALIPKARYMNQLINSNIHPREF